MCQICSKLTIKTPERRQWGPFGVFTVNLEQILHISLNIKSKPPSHDLATLEKKAHQKTKPPSTKAS